MSKANSVEYLLSLCRTIPFQIVEPILRAPSELSIRSETYDGAVLHTDVVGFTTRSEQLARAGRRGQAELTAWIDTLFKRLIEEALLPFGGHAVQFGGDSATVLFTGADAPLRAATAALAIQQLSRADRRSSPTFGSEVVFRTGVAVGPVRLSVVGEMNQRLAVCSGATSHRAVRLQELAAPGAIRIDGAMIAALSPLATYARDTGAGLEPPGVPCAHAELTGLQAPAAPVAPPAFQALLATDTEAKIALLEPFVPAPLAARLRAVPSGWRIEGELRHVVVIFFELGNLDVEIETDLQRRDHANALARSLLRAYRRFGGLAVKADVTSDGHRVMVLYGLQAPSSNDCDSALLAALEATARVKGHAGANPTDPTVRTGVHSGEVYFGAFGTDLRHDVTVLGDVVNTAARIARAAAPFEVLASQAVVQQLGGRFRVSARTPVVAKGKAAPLEVSAVHAPSDGVAHYVQPRRGQRRAGGRDAEVAQLRDVVARAAAGQAGLVGICGAAGTGKSALLSLLIDDWTRRGAIGMMARCRFVSRSQPLAPIVAMFSAFLGLTGADSEQARRHRIREGFRPYDLTDGAPELIALLEPVTRPDGVVESAIDLADSHARERVLASIVEFMLRRVEQEALLYVLEDLHHADSLTLELVSLMAAVLPRGQAHLQVVTYRPEAVVARFRRGVDHEVVLGNLVPAAAEELVLHELRASGIERTLLDFLLRRTDGNPAHLLDVVRFLRERELITIRAGTVIAPQAGVAWLDEVVPNTATHVALARLDEFGGVERRLLRAASAIGASFTRELVESVLSEELDAAEVAAAIALLEGQEVIRADQSRGYGFRDEVTHAVTYASIPAEQRDALHRRIADAIERRPDLELGRDTAAIAWHRDRAGQFDVALGWYERAATAALRARLDDAARKFIDRWAACRLQLSAAQAPGPAVDARVAMLELVALGRLQLGREVLAIAARIEQQFADILDDEAHLVVAYWRGCAYTLLGEPVAAQHELTRVYERTGSRPLRCEAATRIGTLHGFAREVAVATTWLDRAAELADGDPFLEAEIVLNRTNLEDAPEQLEASRATYRRLAAGAMSRGQFVLAANASNNAAHCDLHLGDFSAARAGFAQALALNRSAGSVLNVCNNLVNLGQAWLWDGDAVAARAPLEEALRYSGEANSELWIAETLVHLGAAIALDDDPVEGLRLCEEGGRCAARSAAREAELSCQLHLLRLALERGDAPAVTVELGRCEAIAVEFVTPLWRDAYATLRTRAHAVLAAIGG